jgi:putative heme-binding domain-containing protein
METAEALAEVRQALRDPSESVRLAAAHAAGLNRDARAAAMLRETVSSTQDSAAYRRAAATALGRIHDGAAVPALLDGLRAGGDRFLEHALIFALIQIAKRDATVKGLKDPSPVVRRGALIALDQMDGANLTRDLVTPLLNTDDPALQQTALGIVTARPGWAGEIVGLLKKWLAARHLDSATQEGLRGAILAFARDKTVQELVSGALGRERTPAATRLLLLETMARMPLDRLPASWIAELGRALKDADGQIVRQAVATVRGAAVTVFDAALLALARDSRRSADLRVAALAATGTRLPHLERAIFDFLRKQLNPDKAPLLRLAAAEVLGNSRLTPDQLGILTEDLAGAGALEVPHLLTAYEHSGNGSIGQKLVAALGKAPGRSGVTAEVVRRTLQGYPAEVRAAAGPLLKQLDVDTRQQKARLAELTPLLKEGDLSRGRAVFFGTKAACSACHTVRSEGGRVGPDLSKIGTIRTGADLLESIIFPNASFARGYEPYLVETKGGKVHTGIIARETAEAIYLCTAERAEIRIARSAIESIHRGKVSIMPQGLDAQLSRKELGDLIAYLRSLK